MNYGDCFYGNDGGTYGRFCPPNLTGWPVDRRGRRLREDDELAAVLLAVRRGRR